MGSPVPSYRELRVYQAARDAAMRIFELAKSFPLEERYSMVAQMRGSSRSVCTNTAEAWRKRRPFRPTPLPLRPSPPYPPPTSITILPTRLSVGMKPNSRLS